MEDLSDSGSNYTKLVRTYMSMETCYSMFKHGFNLSQIHTCMPWLSKLDIYWLSVKYNEKPVEASERDLQHFPFSSIFKRRFFIYLSQNIFTCLNNGICLWYYRLVILYQTGIPPVRLLALCLGTQLQFFYFYKLEYNILTSFTHLLIFLSYPVIFLIIGAMTHRIHIAPIFFFIILHCQFQFI